MLGAAGLEQQRAAARKAIGAILLAILAILSFCLPLAVFSVCPFVSRLNWFRSLENGRCGCVVGRRCRERGVGGGVLLSATRFGCRRFWSEQSKAALVQPPKNQRCGCPLLCSAEDPLILSVARSSACCPLVNQWERAEQSWGVMSQLRKGGELVPATNAAITKASTCVRTVLHTQPLLRCINGGLLIV